MFPENLQHRSKKCLFLFILKKKIAVLGNFILFFSECALDRFGCAVGEGEGEYFPRVKNFFTLSKKPTLLTTSREPPLLPVVKDSLLYLLPEVPGAVLCLWWRAFLLINEALRCIFFLYGICWRLWFVCFTLVRFITRPIRFNLNRNFKNKQTHIYMTYSHIISHIG